jgi:hypothetical protein
MKPQNKAKHAELRQGVFTFYSVNRRNRVMAVVIWQCW